MPVLLHGCESWILNNSLLKRLESFQAELGKRILRLPKCTSNRVIRMALRWPSVCARILCIKFNFLKKIGTKDDGLSSRVFRTLAVSDVESIHLVRQCRFFGGHIPFKFYLRSHYISCYYVNYTHQKSNIL